MTNDKLELTSRCWLEDIGWGDINLCYIERAADHWNSDSETTVDVDRDTAEKIIAWLQSKFNFDARFKFICADLCHKKS